MIQKHEEKVEDWYVLNKTVYLLPPSGDKFEVRTA